MEGIKIDATSLLVGASAGCASGALLGYILARRAFSAKLDAKIADEIDAVKHHYQLRAEAADARERDNALERPVSSLAEQLGQPGVLVGYRDPRTDDDDYISWIHPVDLVIKESPTAAAKRSASIRGVEYIDSNGVERDHYGNPVDHLGAIKDAEDRLMADLELSAPVAVDGNDASWPPVDRDRSRPFVISDAEFEEGCDDDSHFHQRITIKWYDADKVLLDDREQVIPDVRHTTGLISKKNFGGVSGDPNIMYVRNEKLEVDFEVVFDERAYTDAVLNYGNPDPRKRK